MEAIAAGPVSDQEFVRQVGLVADLQPRVPMWRIVLLALVLLLAGFAMTFGVLFASNSATTGDSFQSATTQCPMMGSAAKPPR